MQVPAGRPIIEVEQILGCGGARGGGGEGSWGGGTGGGEGSRAGEIGGGESTRVGG